MSIAATFQSLSLYSEGRSIVIDIIFSPFHIHTQFDLSPEIIGLIFLANALTYMVFVLLAGVLADNIVSHDQYKLRRL